MGLLPLYIHLSATFGVGSFEWSRLAPYGRRHGRARLVLLARQGGQVAAVLRRPKTLGVLALSTLAILSNWTIYVVAVDTGHVIEASLGYYINPLMNMAAGALLFRERMSRGSKIAVGLAAVGVAIQTAALGADPRDFAQPCDHLLHLRHPAQAGEGGRPDRPLHRMRLSHDPRPALRAAFAGERRRHTSAPARR